MSRVLLIGVLTSVAFAADEPNEFAVAYTGRLLGYARMPDLQVMEGKDGALRHRTGGPESDSPAARELRRQIEQFRGSAKHTLLLSLGDNFAIDFRSRSVLVPGADGKLRYERKDRLVYRPGRGWGAIDGKELEQESVTAIDHDNVADFLRSAGFDAIVPGKHDFHFGPERLRQLAGLLATGQRKVAMLGSNLVIRSVDTRPFVPKPAAKVKREYVTSMKGLQWAPPSTVLPWIRRIRLRGDTEKAKAELRWCVKPADGAACPVSEKPLHAVRDESKDSWVYFSARDALTITRLEADRLRARSKPAAKLEDVEKSLEEAAKREAAIAPFDPAKTYLACVEVPGRAPYCAEIAIAAPFFRYSDDNTPYFMKHGVAVFGAVSQGLEHAVGAINSQWLNEDPHLDTGVVAVEPAEAISQTIEYCMSRRDCGEHTRYLLLAQMPHNDADVLNRRLDRRFLAVFAQPEENAATSAVPVAYPPEHTALTLVPPPVYSAADRAIEVSLRTLRFERTATGARHRVTTGSLARWTHSVANGHKGCRPVAADFHAAVLRAMRAAVEADAAILQQRDFFDASDQLQVCGPPDEPEPQRAAIERVLWKGDVLAKRTITGAALKAVLAQSRAFDALDQDPYSDHGSSRQGLLMHGIVNTSGTWFVNGQAISDGRLYSIAMSDYLAFGDTGYPALRNHPVPSPFRLANLGKKLLHPIADLVLESLKLPSPEPLRGRDWFDSTTRKAPERPPKASFADQLKLQSKRWLRPLTPAFQKGGSEAAGQSRTYWRVFADQGSIGLTQYRNNQPSAAELSNRFKGITESGVTARESTTWLTAVQLEARREAKWGNFFTRSEAGFVNQDLQAQDGNSKRIRNYLDNRASQETGFRRAIFGNARQRPWLSVLVSSQSSSQIRKPDGSTRTSRFAGKFGARVEGRQNWIETGLAEGWVWRPSLAGIGNTFIGSTVNRESGAFFNFNATLPLPAGIGIREVTVNNRTQYFKNRPRSDLATDARMIERFESSITVPVWANISLKPTYAMLLFRNKVERHFLSGHTFSIRLDYRFDHSTGASWKQVLGFGRP